MNYVGCEVLIAVVMKSSMFWDITPCSLFKVNRRFGGTSCLHLHGRRILQVRCRLSAMHWKNKNGRALASR
jgi:hypothetical protein